MTVRARRFKKRYVLYALLALYAFAVWRYYGPSW